MAKEKTVLVLRCCRADMTSQAGFTWPGVGEVAEAADWIDNSECGNGLHGWLYGQGDHSCTDYWSEVGAKWLVIEVIESHVRMLGGKCKFPRGTVRFVGQKHEAAAHILENEPQAKNVSVIGLSVTVTLCDYEWITNDKGRKKKFKSEAAARAVIAKATGATA